VNDFVAAMRHVAASERVVLVDHHARFIELGGGAFPAGLMADAFHPNAAGHAALALTLARALGIAPHDGRTVPLLEAQVSAALS
jgi:lysophospholipase L1-like esterase